jgi:tRNA pseudouridine55 synthase
MSDQDPPNGILVVDKPEGLTSHDVVARVRRILKTKRVGHTGTLDPFATGVLVLLIGKATRLAQFLDKDAKEYIATVRLGFETKTGDKTGEPVANEEDVAGVSQTEIEVVLRSLLGQRNHTPPMYSAKKVGGTKLYELARQGKEVERQSSTINIYEIGLLEAKGEPVHEFVFRVCCSAGTYIRVLAEEIGRELGNRGHLIALRRTAAGKFDLRLSYELDQLKQMKEPMNALLPADMAVSHLTEYRLDPSRIEKTRNGLSTRVNGKEYKDGEFVRMTEIGGNVIAVGVFIRSENSIKPTVVLN